MNPNTCVKTQEICGIEFIAGKSYEIVELENGNYFIWGEGKNSRIEMSEEDLDGLIYDFTAYLPDY